MSTQRTLNPFAGSPAAKPPAGFRRVDIADLDHLGTFKRRRGEWTEYWSPDRPDWLRQEKSLGVSGRVVRVVAFEHGRRRRATP